MITCPWCGTSYAAFQSNCKNCGAPLQAWSASRTQTSETGMLMPPPAPRAIPDSYAWRLLAADGWAIGGGVLGLVGTIFALVGIVLATQAVTVFIGLPFAGLGMVFLGLGVPALLWRYRQAWITVHVLQQGVATRGQIVSLQENLAVTINGRHPWIITYRFAAERHDYQGQVTTLTLPGPPLQPGEAACVLYLPDAPEHNALYPHP